VSDAPSTDPHEIVGRLFAALDREDEAAAMEAIRDGYAIFNTAGAEGWLPAFADDIEWTQGSDAPEAEIFRGHDGVLEQQRIFQEAWESFRLEPVDYLARGDTVVVVVDMTGKGRASGMELTARGAHLWRLRDGLVTHFQIFIDPDRAREAIA
jgi:ketosteroid isomerase-like protein